VNLKDLQPNCPISFAPSLTAPVFYGYKDYSECNGLQCLGALPKLAPGATPPSLYDQFRPAMRVYFPSLDGSPQSAAILEQCERYPLVLLVHGDCGGDPVVQWDLIPAQLARCGYVVAVTKFGGILSQGDPANTEKLRQAVTWLRTFWDEWRLGSRRTGSKSMRIRSTCWKPSSIRHASAAPVIERRIGWW